MKGTFLIGLSIGAAIGICIMESSSKARKFVKQGRQAVMDVVENAQNSDN